MKVQPVFDVYLLLTRRLTFLNNKTWYFFVKFMASRVIIHGKHLLNLNTIRRIQI